MRHGSSVIVIRKSIKKFMRDVEWPYIKQKKNAISTVLCCRVLYGSFVKWVHVILKFIVSLRCNGDFLWTRQMKNSNSFLSSTFHDCGNCEGVSL